MHNCKLFKFTYSSPFNASLQNQIMVITGSWPEAFNLIYEKFGDSVSIYNVEYLGNTDPLCIIDTKYYAPQLIIS